MKKIIRENHSPLLSLLFLVILLVSRMLFHRNFHFAFLFWNVFLAALPLIISTKITLFKKGYSRYLLFGIWLLLFPNAAYLITDITHIQDSSGSGYWLDLVLLFSAAVFGVSVAAKSLHQVETWYRSLLSQGSSNLLTVMLLLLNGYGIYLGRIERWNSWDALTETYSLFAAVAHQIRHPFRCQEVWLQSMVFALVPAIVYYLLYRRLALRPRHAQRDAPSIISQKCDTNT